MYKYIDETCLDKEIIKIFMNGKHSGLIFNEK